MNLSFKPVHCDEGLSWIRGVPDNNGKPQLFKNKYLLIEGQSLNCASPDRLAGRLVLSLGKYGLLMPGKINKPEAMEKLTSFAAQTNTAIS